LTVQVRTPTIRSMASTKGVFDEIIAALAVEAAALFGGRLVSLVIYGSVGRGTARPDSDLDFLVVVSGLPRSRLERLEVLERLDSTMRPWLKVAQAHGVTTYLSPLLKTPEEALRGSPVFFDMVEDARLVIDRDGFFAGVLERLHARMRELGSKRIWRGTRWYWVLKPDCIPGEVIEI
jgi:predicted nucleotidyltransferase